MPAAQSQPNLLQSLAYKMGERTVNSTTSASRAVFVQETLQELYQAYPWRWARTTATLAISGGIATLPSALDSAQLIRASYYSGTQQIDLGQVDVNDTSTVDIGNNQFWFTSNPDGTFLLNTKETVPANAVVVYQTLAPTLDAAGVVTTPYPNPNTIVLGARRWVKLGQNPDADISQDQAIFEKMRDRDIAAEQVPSARKKRRTAQDMAGTVTGGSEGN